MKDTIQNNLRKNPWTAEDEGDHYPTMKEWWCIETLFKTLDDKRKWNLKFSMAYEMETPSCFFDYVLFDITSKKCVLHKAINDDIKKFTHIKNKVDLKYKKSTIKGLYPKYKIHLEDDTQEFTADMTYNANIPPHWSAQDATNGYLPIGFDYYRYGWLLNCNLVGSIKIKDETHKIDGKGYIEHAWGNWSYSNPFQKLSSLRKTISTYGNLIYWWFSEKKAKIPNRISFTTENNPFGYDWFWGIFDNNWSVFYGNSLFWISEGTSFGVLTLAKEDGTHLDFNNLYFKYNKTKYLEKYDIYYPTDITIIGEMKNRKIKLRACSLFEKYEYIDEFPADNFYKAFIMPEMPGEIEGHLIENNKKIKLKGDCKIVHQRQPSKLGHNSLIINFLKPPKGVGISFDLNLFYMKKKMFTKFQLAPKPSFNIKVNRLEKSHNKE